MDNYIFHIASIEDWNLAKTNNDFYQCSSLQKEGFIHASKFNQLNFVLNKFYQNNNKIILLKIDIKKLTSEIKWEKSELNVDSFPHIYGEINIDSVVETVKYDRLDDYIKTES